MKNTITFLSLWITSFALATNYYVSQLTGNVSNNGLSVSTAFFEIQQAQDVSQPGDTIFVMNGIYTNSNPANNILNIYQSGTASAWVTYKNYPNHSPIIQLFSNNWCGICIQGADYIIIDGFTVIGNNDNITLDYAQSQQNNTNNPATSGNGIGCGSEYGNPSNKSHHVIVKNCVVKKCGGGGIFSYNADYLTIENNIVSECGWYSPYGNSGISLYQNWNSDNSIDIKNYVIGNTCYRNQNYIPFFVAGTITDGNGIIIDDARNTQNSSTLGIYLAKTFVANNVVFDNGGRGIHCYLSDNVIIVNNTCYKNCQSPVVHDGELTAFDSGAITFVNNISSPNTNIPPIASFDAPNIVVDYNLWTSNTNLTNPIGTNYVTADPNFVSPSSNPNIANFRVQQPSGAIDAGTTNFATPLDKDGNVRVGNVDLGAYEFQSVLSNPKNIFKSYFVYPNPALDTVNIQLMNSDLSVINYKILNILGEEMCISTPIIINGNCTIPVNNLSSGMYFIIVNDTQKIKFIKK